MLHEMWVKMYVVVKILNYDALNVDFSFLRLKFPGCVELYSCVDRPLLPSAKFCSMYSIDRLLEQHA
jgi:hypothetical protein